MSSDRVTTYQAAHINNIASAFDPSKSWILTATNKPFASASSSASSASAAAAAASLLSDLNSGSTPAPSLALPARFTSPPPSLSSPPHPLYHTANSQYGRRAPTVLEMPSVYFGHQFPFSSEFEGGMYRQSGLETGVRKSRIVNGKEELGW